jgi:hypothetical protein
VIFFGDLATSAPVPHSVDHAMQLLAPLLSKLERALVPKLATTEHATGFDIAISLWSLATLRTYTPASFNGLLERASCMADRLSPTDMAHIMWACGCVRHRTRFDVLDRIADRAAGLIDDFEPRELLQLVWGMSRVKLRNTPLLTAAVACLKAKAPQFQTREIVTLLYTFTKLKFTAAKRAGVYQVALAEMLAPKREQALNTQDIANTLWALARMKVDVDGAMLDQLAEYALTSIGLFQCQELACTAYGYGLLKHRHERLMSVIALRALQLRASMTHQELCLVLWALGKLEVSPGEDMLAAFSAEFESRISVLQPLTIANVIKAFAKLEYTPSADLMNLISIEGRKRIKDFKMAEISNLLWAYKQLRWKDDALFKVAEEYVSDNVDQCTRHHVSSIIASLQGIGFQPEVLVTSARSHGLQA